MWHTVIVTATEFENFFALRCPNYEYHGTGNLYRSKKDFIKDVPQEKAENYKDLFWLQINKGQAEIHMMALAEAMWDAYNESTPKELKAGEWHVPFGDNINVSEVLKIAPYLSVDQESLKGNINNQKIKIATARCARVSYTVVGEDGKESNYENDIKLHDRLLQSGHMSPFEHCARAMKKFKHFDTVAPMSGNFRGWEQYRKMIDGEDVFRK
jgi:hypothetical protein